MIDTIFGEENIIERNIMNAYFIADTHFDDENIMNYENRPFTDANEMNGIIISRWIEIVK